MQFDTTDSAGSTSPSAPEYVEFNSHESHIVDHFFHSLFLHSLGRASSPGRRFEQNVEQARPADETEEEMQLRLALQISKQQAEEEERLK